MSFPFDLPMILAAVEMGDLDLPECVSPERPVEDDDDEDDE